MNLINCTCCKQAEILCSPKNKFLPCLGSASCIILVWLHNPSMDAREYNIAITSWDGPLLSRIQRHASAHSMPLSRSDTSRFRPVNLETFRSCYESHLLRSGQIEFLSNWWYARRCLKWSTFVQVFGAWYAFPASVHLPSVVSQQLNWKLSYRDLVAL